MSRAFLVLATIALAGCFDGYIPADPALFDAFSKGREVSDYLIAQQVEEVPAGNAILGQGGGAAHLKRFSASVRVGSATRSMPTLAGATLSEASAQAATLSTTAASATSVHVDVAAPIVRGFALGNTRILSVELLGSATYSSSFQTNDLGASRGSALSFGVGQRIGVVAETDHFPGISFSSVRRTLPSLSWEDRGVPTDQANEATLRMYELGGHIVSHRLAVSKSLGNMGITAGWGTDGLTAHYSLSARVSGPPEHTGQQSTTAGANRSVLFVGGSYALHRDLTIAAEVSRTSREAPRYQTNVIGDAGERTRTTVMVGVKVGG